MSTATAPIPWQKKLYAHAVVMPRPFAAPVAVLGVMLGALLVHAGAVNTLLASLTAVLVMFWGHSANGILDYYWTGLDKSEQGSKKKPYTAGQNVIRDGILSRGEALGNAYFWLLASAIPMCLLAYRAASWDISLDVLLVWLIAAAATGAYSWGKLHWTPEITLLVGFGMVPTALGALAAEHLTAGMFWRAVAAGVPFGLLFGFAAEIVDQAYDGDQWDIGLRSIGPWLVHNKKHLAGPVMGFVVLAAIAHVCLVLTGVLSPYSLFGLAIIPFCWKIAPLWDSKRDYVRDRGILIGLGCVVAYCVWTVIGQAVGG